MAQDFCGANNINLLKPLGNFGSRRMGGKDAASARYIFTQLNECQCCARDCYTITATNNSGCTATNSVAITVTPTNTASSASSSPTLCINTVLIVLVAPSH